MTQHFTTPDGTRLTYDLHGSGKPLLCLAGLTRNRTDFDYVLPHLSGVQVIRMDYRGRGDSDWAAPATYTPLQEAQDALALLDHLALPRTAILGTSRGGLIALVLGQIAKPRLTGVCFNDVGPKIERAALERIALYVGRQPFARTLAEQALVIERANLGAKGVPLSRWLEEAARQTRPATNGLTLTYDPALRDSFMASLATPPLDLWPLYDALAPLPLAAIRGANSDLLSAATFEEMQRRRPDLIAATVPNRGHVPFLDEPASLAALRAFIAALP